MTKVSKIDLIEDTCCCFEGTSLVVEVHNWQKQESNNCKDKHKQSHHSEVSLDAMTKQIERVLYIFVRANLLNVTVFHTHESHVQKLLVLKSLFCALNRVCPLILFPVLFKNL